MGKLEGIDDLVSFEGGSVAELEAAFREAVDDCKALCSQDAVEREARERSPECGPAPR
jgi:predicted HicB family RNase H-like nuclease